MTREDIIRMAQEAGLGDTGVREGFIFFQPGTDGLERFAALVAAAERNKVAQWMIARSYATGHGDTVEDLLKELVQSVREEERELCAQVCEFMRPSKPEFDERYYAGCTDSAAAIRARREQ